MTTIHCLLWDFGDTLCDETFIWGSGPEWLEVYEKFDEGFCAAWNLGEINTQQFAVRLSQQMGISSEAVVAHMVERCRHIEFFPKTYAFFRKRELPQAIVTVNPDIFTAAIEPLYEFSDVCAAIVTSWEEQTVDKGALCAIALERMGVDCSPEQALLLDNKRENIEAWSGRGGATYLYTTDDQFARDLDRGVDSLSTRGA